MLEKETFLTYDLEYKLNFSCTDCTKCRNIKKTNIVSIQCIYVFLMVFKINRSFFT